MPEAAAQGPGMPAPAPKRHVAYISVSLSTLFWGTSFVSVKALLPVVSPVTVITVRFLIAVAFLWIVDGMRRASLRGQNRAGARPSFAGPLVPPRQHSPTIALLGFIGVFVHHMLQANALRFTSSASAGWLVALNPLFIATFAAILLRERFPVRVKTGFAVALLGVLLIVSRGDPRAALKSPSSIGDVLMIASGVNWAVYSTVLKRAGLPYPPLLATLWAESFGLLLLLPFWLLGGGPAELVRVSPAGWVHFVSLGVLSSGLAYLFWGRALCELKASQVAAFQYLQPTVTMTASALVLGERLGWWLLAGGAVIIYGIAVVNKPNGASGDTSSGASGGTSSGVPDGMSSGTSRA